MNAEPGLQAYLVQTLPRRLSTVLRDLDARGDGPVTLGDLSMDLGDRSFVPFLVLLTIPNMLLIVPGASVLTGIPLILVAMQLMLGRSSLWLPRVLRERAMGRGMFSRIVAAGLPYVERVERLARPRYWPLPNLMVERAVGLICVLMAIIMVLPIPFANWLPAAAVLMLALALSERDGLWLLGGALFAAATLVLVSLFVGASALALVVVMD